MLNKDRREQAARYMLREMGHDPDDYYRGDFDGPGQRTWLKAMVAEIWEHELIHEAISAVTEES